MTERTFPLSGPINLQVRVGRGSLTVNAVDGLSEARVSITGRKGSAVESYTVEMDGRTLKVMRPREGGIFDLPLLGKAGRDGVDVVVEVPAGTATKISTFSADVTVTGRVGGADIAGGSAKIAVEHADGDLRLRYGSGAAKAGLVSGSVQARSGSGRAEFGTVGGALNCSCGSGELRVDLVRGDLRSRAGSGNALIGAAHGDVDLASGSGAISIGLPAGRPAQLNLTTGSGEVISELPIDKVSTSKGEPISVRARTGSGDIRLFRADREAERAS